MTTKITAERSFYALLVAVGLATYVVHELAHWSAGEALGYAMTMHLNGAAPATATSPFHAMLISIAGPLITVVQAIVAAVLAIRSLSLNAYAFVYWAAFMRFAATLVSVFHPNDEARVSTFFGWGMWPLPIAVTITLISLTWYVSRRLKVSWKTNLLAYVVVSAVMSAIVGVDMVSR